MFFEVVNNHLEWRDTSVTCFSSSRTSNLSSQHLAQRRLSAHVAEPSHGPDIL